MLPILHNNPEDDFTGHQLLMCFLIYPQKQTYSILKSIYSLSMKPTSTSVALGSPSLHDNDVLCAAEGEKRCHLTLPSIALTDAWMCF